MPDDPCTNAVLVGPSLPALEGPFVGGEARTVTEAFPEVVVLPLE